MSEQWRDFQRASGTHPEDDQPMTKPDVEPCALCRQKPYTGLYGLVMCDDDDCPSAAEYVAPDVWNEFQRRITAELRKAFEAGANSIGWRDSSMLRQDTTFDDWQKQRGRK